MPRQAHTANRAVLRRAHRDVACGLKRAALQRCPVHNFYLQQLAFSVCGMCHYHCEVAGVLDQEVPFAEQEAKRTQF